MATTTTKMLVTVEQELIRIIKIGLHYDDESIVYKEVKIGDDFACTYVHDRTLLAISGRVTDIILNTNQEYIIKLDTMKRKEFCVIHLIIENIRGFIEPERYPFIELYTDYVERKKKAEEPETRVVETLAGAIDALEWRTSEVGED